ncbi:hypothetical protein D3C72_486190 [compost metagenome]
MLEALLRHERLVFIVGLRPLELLPGVAELQREQVVAGQEAVEVRGRKDEFIEQALHDNSLTPARCSVWSRVTDVGRLSVPGDTARRVLAGRARETPSPGAPRTWWRRAAG